MTRQPTLLDPKVITPEYTIPEADDSPARETGLTLAEPQPPRLLDFRTSFMSLTVEQMQDGLNEYGDRRAAFRAWIFENLKEGLHYGYAPGCEPKYCDQKGKPCAKEVAWGTLGYKGALISLDSWLPKQSLFAAGADLICDLMWVRDEYAADMETWQQLGSAPGQIVRKCKLFSRVNEKFLGEGTGGRINGQKGGDLNNAIKMADKSSKVAATLNTWGLRDLFTQDEPPDNNPPLRPSPEADPNAATAQPRGERVTDKNIESLVDRWRKCIEPGTATPTNWKAFVLTATCREFDPLKSGNWSKADFDAVHDALKARDA